MRVCEALLARGFYAQGIRHPSVPVGTARLRVTLMSSHTERDVDALADVLTELLAMPDAPEAGTGRDAERGTEADRGRDAGPVSGRSAGRAG